MYIYVMHLKVEEIQTQVERKMNILALGSHQFTFSQSNAQKLSPSEMDKFRDMEFISKNWTPEMDTKVPDNDKSNIWGIIERPTGTVTIYNSGGVESSGDVDIDWNSLQTAKSRANAILQKYGGVLTMNDTSIAQEKSSVHEYSEQLSALANSASFFKLANESFEQSTQDLYNTALVAYKTRQARDY